MRSQHNQVMILLYLVRSVALNLLCNRRRKSIFSHRRVVLQKYLWYPHHPRLVKWVAAVAVLGFEPRPCQATPEPGRQQFLLLSWQSPSAQTCIPSFLFPAAIGQHIHISCCSHSSCHVSAWNALHFSGRSGNAQLGRPEGMKHEF